MKIARSTPAGNGKRASCYLYELDKNGTLKRREGRDLSDFQFILGGNMTVKAHIRLAQAQCKADKLLQMEDGHLCPGVDGLPALRLVHVKLHLAEGTWGGDALGICLVRAVHDLACDGQHIPLRCQLGMEAAALTAGAEKDRLRPQLPHQFLHILRMLAVAVIHHFLGPQDMAAIVAGHLHARQRVLDFPLQKFRVIVQQPEEMGDFAGSLVLIGMSGILQQPVDLVPKLLVCIQPRLRRAQLQCAGIADREDRQPHMLRNGDIAGIDSQGSQLIDTLGVRSAAACPVCTIA